MFKQQEEQKQTMIKHQFAIFDMKAKLWSDPFYSVSIGAATRQFSDLANDLQHPIGQHPEDYALYQIGEWDAFSGDFFGYETKTSLGIAADFKKNPVNNEETQQ